MSQKHLYGESYTEMNPPKDWTIAGVQITIDDSIDTTETTFTGTEFTFVGDVASWIESYHIPTYGVFNGVRYKVNSIDDFTGSSTTIFDGFIDLSKRTILSKYPNIFTAPIVDFNNNSTVFEQVSVLTQGLLAAQGFLNTSDFVSVPVVRESKKNIAERTLILQSLLADTVGLFTRLVQDLFSALSDILGVSLPVGIVEILLLVVNAILEINLLAETILKHKDLFFPAIYYYPGVKLKSLITKSFQKIGYTVDFGVIDEVLSKIVLLGSQDNNDGSIIPDVFFESGILKTQDYGYLISEAMETVQTFFNTHQDIRDGVVHIKNKYDPSWTNSPLFTPDNILLDSTDQYTNGTVKENTEDLKAVVLTSYKYDESDAHTLTEKNGDYHEVRRALITELDPKLNTLKGVQEIKINYAIAVRKQFLDNLFDLFPGITEQFDFWLDSFKTYVENYADTIPYTAGVSEYISEILSLPFISFITESRSGALKIEDNTYAIPKLIYLEDGKIPENFKDIIGAKAIYDNYYKQGSPADINDFKGQEVLRNDWNIPFTVTDFNLVKLNPYFVFDGNNVKFTSVNWIDDKREAITNSKEYKIFDTNITEYEI
jgi:hypothetical protein